MDEKLKGQLWQIAKRLAGRPTKLVGTRELRDKLGTVLDGASAGNLVVLDHGRPRAVVLDWETYELLDQLARLITFEVAQDESSEVTEEELAELAMKREARRPRRRQATSA